jgi:hypothetical protein
MCSCVCLCVGMTHRLAVALKVLERELIQPKQSPFPRLEAQDTTRILREPQMSGVKITP